VTFEEQDRALPGVDPAIFGRALLTASSVNPEDLLDELRSQFAGAHGAIDLALHLIDYRLKSLRPVETHGSPGLLRPESVVDSALGASFRLQRATAQQVPAGHLHHVPVSVRGQRLGVLTGTFPEPPSIADERALRSLALALAHTVLEAGAGTDAYEVDRRHGRMSVAAEMQWQLLPARAYQTSDFYIAGHLEPALRVAGDAFDFAVNARVLTLAVVDATGTSGSPSSLTTLVITALRNARRSGLGLDEQAALAGDVVWQYGGGREHAAALLLQLDGSSGRAVAVDAGSPALARVRAGLIEPQPLDAQTPLGMFEGTRYQEEPVDLRPGDRMYLLTDGAYTEGRDLTHIADLLSSEQHGAGQVPPESIRRLVATLTVDGQEPEDDITVVCVDWTEPAPP
jgi:hypothetical protein